MAVHPKSEHMITRPSVFLCGPISGDPNAAVWRQKATESLRPEIAVLDPTRLRTSTIRWSSATAVPDPYARSRHGKGVLQRNQFDLSRTDLVLANFLGAREVSIGSVGELFWAHAMQKPVVVVRETSGNPHDHDILNEIAGWILEDLDQALQLVRTIVLAK